MAKQIPRFSVTCNLSIPQAEELDAIRMRMNLTRHALVLRCIETALPLLVGEADHQHPAERKQPGKLPQG